MYASAGTLHSLCACLHCLRRFIIACAAAVQWLHVKKQQCGVYEQHSPDCAANVILKHGCALCVQCSPPRHLYYYILGFRRQG